MPKWNIFLISSNEFVWITENFWQIFWLWYLTQYKTPALETKLKYIKGWESSPEQTKICSYSVDVTYKWPHSCWWQQNRNNMRVGKIQLTQHALSPRWSCAIFQFFIEKFSRAPLWGKTIFITNSNDRGLARITRVVDCPQNARGKTTWWWWSY